MGFTILKGRPQPRKNARNEFPFADMVEVGDCFEVPIGEGDGEKIGARINSAARTYIKHEAENKNAKFSIRTLAAEQSECGVAAIGCWRDPDTDPNAPKPVRAKKAASIGGKGGGGKKPPMTPATH